MLVILKSQNVTVLDETYLLNLLSIIAFSVQRSSAGRELACQRSLSSALDRYSVLAISVRNCNRKKWGILNGVNESYNGGEETQRVPPHRFVKKKKNQLVMQTRPEFQLQVPECWPAAGDETTS